MSKKPRSRWIRLTDEELALTRNALNAYTDEASRFDNEFAIDAMWVAGFVVQKIDALYKRRS